MKFYIAAPFEAQQKALAWMRILETNGHDCTARWVTDGRITAERPDLWWANTDLSDIHAADVVILMTEPAGNPRGGRHFEFGYAYHSGKRCIVCGPRASVFHHLERIEQYDTIQDVAYALAPKVDEAARTSPLIGHTGGAGMIGS